MCCVCVFEDGGVVRGKFCVICFVLRLVLGLKTMRLSDILLLLETGK